MRATKGYVVGLGTTSALIGAIGCAFALLSAIVAVQGWPLRLSAPGTSTVDGRGAALSGALPPLDVFPGAGASGRRGARDGDPGRAGATVRAGFGGTDAAPVASAFGLRGSDRASAPAPHAGPAPGAGAAGLAPAGGGPVAGSVGAPSGSTPTAPSDGGPGADAPAPTLGGAVTQVTSSAGTAVAQTGQQLSGTVQGATGQLGGAVGQVSPAAGQVVTQTAQAVGGVVSGTTGGVGQAVAGTGATAGGLLGGLTGGG